ncbi:MAG: OmpA family protein, partial [Bacteroidia bacterium]
HPEYTNASKWYIVNAGKTINTAMPEYVPVLIGNDKLIFTSKRKDNKKERINPDNGKYYESIYSSTISNGHTSAPVLFRIPEQLGKQKTNSNQSVISAMAGGKKIFVYEKGKLFESDLTATTKSPEEESKVINFDSYQNHAFLDKTDKVLYFTSESPNGQGGNDIYRSYRTADGQWSAPENLGDVINTPFDEEAPFISEDGNTLYFASNGFPGYGGYDIYKSTLVNGKWSVPENLGQPVNSPANDIFYSESVDGSVAYMSSSRKGGQGDMDIYKINYTDKQPKSCNANLDDFLSLDFKKNDLNNGRHLITAAIPDKMKDQIISFELKVDDSLIGNFDSKMEFNFKQEGDHTINAKLVAWCDTCINTLVACTEKKLSITNINPDLTISTNLNANNNSNTADLSLSKVFNDAHGTLDKTLLKQIGFDLTPLYFKKNEANLTDDAVSILEKNMELLKKYPDLKIIINGYADSRGSENYNQKLSEHRADEVKKYFNKNHLKNQTEVVGKGETELVNKCGNDVDCDETMHQQNRRVEFTIIKK